MIVNPISASLSIVEENEPIVIDETNRFLSIIRPKDQLLAVDLVESIWLYVVIRINILSYKAYKDARNAFISMVEGHMCNLHELITKDMWHNKWNYFSKSAANIIHIYLSTKDIYVIQDMESLLQGLTILHMLLLLVNRQWLVLVNMKKI